MKKYILNLLTIASLLLLIEACFAGEVSVKDYGAVGDGQHDDTVAISKALASGSSVYIPAGWYRVQPGKLKVSGGGKSIRGDSRSSSVLITGTYGPILTVDTSPQTYYLCIQNLGFVQDTKSVGNAKSSAGILITDSGPSYFAYCRLSSLLFLGTYHGILNTRTTDNGGESQGDWNTFTELAMTNYGENNVHYGILFRHGSGTGNIFSTSTLICTDAGIQIGDGVGNVGDITFQGLQQGGGGTGIRLAAGKHYGSNITITGSQWDAGITHSLEFTRMNSFRIFGCSFGGATRSVFVNCTNYWIDGTHY